MDRLTKKERIAKLKSIDFVWEVVSAWEKRFHELKDYRKKYGHCLVPQNYQQNKQLANWVNNQKMQ